MFIILIVPIYSLFLFTIRALLVSLQISLDRQGCLSASFQNELSHYAQQVQDELFELMLK